MEPGDRQDRRAPHETVCPPPPPVDAPERIHTDAAGGARREPQLELSEPSAGLFILECEYEDRFTPKDAGLNWHAGDRCRRPKCTACAANIGRVWHTSDVLKALKLAEHASSELRAEIMRRAQPLAEGQVESERERARAARVQKLQRVRSLQASCATDSPIEVPVPDGLEYMPYQRAAIAFALGRASTLIADEMGLGKTIEALGVVNADSTIQRVLIVCPASLKLNWKREAERWLTRSMRCEIAGKSFPQDADVVIINYERLGKWESQLARDWDLLIADECHYVKNRDAKRTKRLFAIKARKMLFLTGTPILNRPIELHPIAGHLSPDAFGDFWTYAKRYCSPVRNHFGWDFNGAANLGELHHLLRSTVMIRRTKADVLPSLPPKRRQVIELSSDHMARLIARETRAWDEHSQTLAEIRGHARDSTKAANTAPGELDHLRKRLNVAFGELSKLRRETALAKVPLVVEHIRNAIESSGKLVVFAHHLDVIAGLAEPFGDAAVTLTGKDNLDRRQASVDRFQDDPTCALFVGSITAAGLGLTLTASSHVMFAELDWVPAHLTQAEDRTHRIGQENSVLVQHLVLQDSLDARMVRTLIKKQRIVDKVVDGELQTELFGEDLALELIETASARSHDEADE